MTATCISIAKQAAYMPFDYWKTAATDGKLLIKTVDLATSVHKFTSLYVPGSAITEGLGGLCSWAKPTVVLFKPWTDGIEPLKDLLENGARLCTQGKYVKLAAKVALVAGLWLALPVYLSSIGLFSLGVFATNVGTVQVLTALDFIRFGLLNFGTNYKLYESRHKLGEKQGQYNIAKLSYDHWHKENVSNTETTATVDQVRWYAERRLRIAELELRNAKLDVADGVTKTALYAATMFSTYFIPVGSLAGVVFLNVFNKGVGCVKDFADTKKRKLDDEIVSYLRKNNLVLNQVNIGAAAA